MAGRMLDCLLAEYGKSLQNATNIRIHWINEPLNMGDNGARLLAALLIYYVPAVHGPGLADEACLRRLCLSSIDQVEVDGALLDAIAVEERLMPH